MSEMYKRKKYLNTNKYQRQIIRLAIVPSLAICVIISIMIKVYHMRLIDVLLFGSFVEGVNFVNNWSIFLLASLWSFFIFIVMWAFVVSLRLVGAFNRIIKEMDDVISGKNIKHIGARPRDHLANELLKRINVLIDKMQK